MSKEEWVMIRKKDMDFILEQIERIKKEIETKQVSKPA